VEQPPFRSILQPADFSLGDESAFLHALRLAVAARSAIHILHVDEAEESSPDRFPDALEALVRWKMLEADSPAEAVESRLGVKTVKSALRSKDIAQAIGAYADGHASDLLVLHTHERSWRERLFAGSLAEASARLAHAPAFFLREDRRGFVDENTGKVRLRRVLMPVAADVAPMRAWGFASSVVRMLEPLAEFHLLHVGDTLPTFGNMLPYVELKRGPVEETILETAEHIGPDLIVMATAGHKTLLDDLRGSTTERVLRHAPCPVLAIPDKPR
jgi:nucleotide-binding universal stress UspA family protein